MQLGDGPVTLADFVRFCAAPERITISKNARARLVQDRETVDKIAAGDTPVYGLNTGLGANLGHRLSRDEIPDFQAQIIRGRTVATGEYLDADTGRGLVLARLVSAANGGSGISPELFDFLSELLNCGLAPAIPETGSIGAGDLTQNAAFASILIGEGQVWQTGTRRHTSEALLAAGLTAPHLKAKEAMVLINHAGLTTVLAAQALHRARQVFNTSLRVIALTYEAYGAAQDILSAEVNEVRPAPGQAEVAASLRALLEGSERNPRRIQEAISLRAVAPLMGALDHAIQHATDLWQDEANALSDSPLVLQDGTMASTPNFANPALALAMESVCLALAMGANAMNQRIQRLMNPDLTGLPRYLSPVGGASAGMVPMQKTAAALNAKIRQAALPIAFDPAPVSDQVEDIAPLTPLVAEKLSAQLSQLELLTAIEAMTAAQALDLRRPKAVSPAGQTLHQTIRKASAMLAEDRSLSPDISAIRDALFTCNSIT